MFSFPAGPVIRTKLELERSGMNLDDYFPGTMTFHMDKGRLDLMPVGLTSIVACLNEDLFGEHGVPLPSRDWEDSWNWDDMLGYGRALTHREEERIRSAGYSLYNSPSTWLPFVWGNGGRWLKEENGLTLFALDERPALEALNFLHSIFQRFRYGIAAGERAAFTDGSVAVYLTGTWWIDPTLDLPFDWGVYPLPRGPKGPVTKVMTDPLGILSTSKNPGGAWRFLEWLNGPEGSLHLIRCGVFGVPAQRIRASENLEYLYAFRPGDDSRVILSSMNYLRAEGIGPGYGDLFNIARDAFTNSVLKGEVPVAEAMSMAAHGSNLLLRQLRP